VRVDARPPSLQLLRQLPSRELRGECLQAEAVLRQDEGRKVVGPRLLDLAIVPRALSREAALPDAEVLQSARQLLWRVAEGPLLAMSAA
jgi:hypothetical protein